VTKATEILEKNLFYAVGINIPHLVRKCIHGVPDILDLNSRDSIPGRGTGLETTQPSTQSHPDSFSRDKAAGVDHSFPPTTK
jgi:hypothetical protein